MTDASLRIFFWHQSGNEWEVEEVQELFSQSTLTNFPVFTVDVRAILNVMGAVVCCSWNI